MDIKFRILSSKDIKSIKQLSDHIFGKSYIIEKELISYMNSKCKSGIVVYTKNDLCGFVLYEISKQKKGLIKSIAINTKYQEKGIATKLVETTLKQLKNKVTEIKVFTWYYPDNHLIKILQKHNFNLVETISNYWKDDSLKRNYECKVCGKPPCLCAAQIWRKL